MDQGAESHSEDLMAVQVISVQCVCLISHIQQQSEPSELPPAVMNVSVSVFIVWSGVKYHVVMLATATCGNPY